jgi:hypothetical protein
MDHPAVPSKQPTIDFLTLALETTSAINVSVRGAQFIVNISEHLLEIGEGGIDGDDEDDEEKDFHEVAAMARESIESEFAVLHNNALMGLWGALEACVDDIAINWLAETSGACAETATRTLKVPLGDYLALNDDARWPWLLDQIKRSQSSSLKAGVGQFESVLDAVGLGGPVDSDLRTAIFYAKAMRNVIAHKGGRIDAKFVEACPHLPVTEGAQLHMSHGQFMAALAAMIVYVQVVNERARVVTGLSPEPLPQMPTWITKLEDLPRAFEHPEVELVGPEDSTEVP